MEGAGANPALTLIFPVIIVRGRTVIALRGGRVCILDHEQHILLYACPHNFSRRKRRRLAVSADWRDLSQLGTSASSGARMDVSFCVSFFANQLGGRYCTALLSYFPPVAVGHRVTNDCR